jgi:hypothetical protein
LHDQSVFNLNKEKNIMSKKVFTILLLAVFMLAQFSVASAVTAAGTGSITSIPVFANNVSVDIAWAVTGMAGPAQNILLWGRLQQTPAVAYAVADCRDIATIVGTSDASGTFTYAFTAAPANGQVWEFTVTVDDALCAGASTVPTITDVLASTTVDSLRPIFGYIANPPSLNPAAFDLLPVACNTFELWAIANDGKGFLPPTVAYSGFGAWNPQVTGTFAPPAPIGPDADLLSWVTGFPSTASGLWSFSVNPEDAAGNKAVALASYRTALAVVAAEKADCADFPDTAGHADEVHIRYLADLGLISGFADGTFGPDNTLTRAEASTLFEKANGVLDTDPGFGTPPAAGSACAFTDVLATDWFAGWVWQACADGFMNGVGGGLFDPNNLLTRGQVVTIFNNIWTSGGGAVGGYLDFAGPDTVLSDEWSNWGGPQIRSAAWTDVSIGAFYATPVVNAYGFGVAEGTSATTFSPDQAATRGEFASMLYRALSRTVNIP